MIFIASATTTGGASSISFSSIPQTYNDLVLFISSQGTAGTNAQLVSFNGSTSSFSDVHMYGNGASTTTASSLARLFGLYNSPTVGDNIYTNNFIYIPNYASSTTRKSFTGDVTSENPGSVVTLLLGQGVWGNTDAINSITITLISGNTYSANSTAYLYGIKNA